ncbi:MAG: peptide deformylase [Pseudomonadota bacterium]
MAVREILKMGDPRLLEVSQPVSDHEISKLGTLLDDMWDTMAEANGAGLAAPQIGVMKRIVIFGYQENPRYPDAPPVPETVLINPVITTTNEDMNSDWEGCLSVPGMRGKVYRYQEIRYQGIDQFGKPIDRLVSDFHARVVQHECDHLDGILYPQRIRDLREFGFIDTLLNHGRLQKQICDD